MNPCRPMVPDDQIIYRMLDGVWVPLAAQLAWEFGLFEALAAGAASQDSLARTLELPEAAVDLLAAACASFGLVRRSGRHGQLVELNASYRSLLLQDSADSQWALMRLSRFDRSLDAARAQLRAALKSAGTRLPGFQGDESWIELLRDTGFASCFAAAMSAHSRLPARACFAGIHLDHYQHLLDIGGGVGVYALAALAQAPALQATVLELPAMVRQAQKIAGDPEPRLQFVAGDFWSPDWPHADLHLFADVVHDWNPRDVARLLALSHRNLPSGGRVVLHELLLDDDHSGPLAVIGSALSMLVWTGGRQYSACELELMLASAGFVQVQTRRTYGAWGQVSAVKN